MTTEQKPTATATARMDRIPRRRARWLLALARSCYKTYLRANCWRQTLNPSPLKGGGMIVKWTRLFGGKRYVLTMEEALQSESNLHRSRLNQEATR